MTATTPSSISEELIPQLEESGSGPGPSDVDTCVEPPGEDAGAHDGVADPGAPLWAVELVLNDVSETMLVALDDTIPDNWSSRRPGVVQVEGTRLSDRVALVSTGDFLNQLGHLLGWRVLFLAASSRFIVEEGFHDAPPISWMPTFRDEAFVLMDEALLQSTF